MLVFRILCAILMAWAVNLSLSRGEAEQLLQTLPEMETLAPIAAALVGYFNLSVRQGWGFIVAFANGIWAGTLAIALAGVLYMMLVIVQGVRTNLIKNFDNFLNVFSDSIQPLLVAVADIPLVTVSLGASAVVGVVTEVVHWLLVRVKERNGGPGPKST